MLNSVVIDSFFYWNGLEPLSPTLILIDKPLILVEADHTSYRDIFLTLSASYFKVDINESERPNDFKVSN